jgi:hypothetical protein
MGDADKTPGVLTEILRWKVDTGESTIRKARISREKFCKKLSRLVVSIGREDKLIQINAKI